jgi:hypothetical protein
MALIHEYLSLASWIQAVLFPRGGSSRTPHPKMASGFLREIAAR